MDDEDTWRNSVEQSWLYPLLLQNLRSFHELWSVGLAQLSPTYNAVRIQQKLSWAAHIVAVRCLFGDQQIEVANGLRASIGKNRKSQIGSARQLE